MWKCGKCENVNRSQLYLIYTFTYLHIYTLFILLHNRELPHASLQTDREQFLRFNRKFHRQVIHHFLCKTVND
jgi:hypothetical protein